MLDFHMRITETLGIEKMHYLGHPRGAGAFTTDLTIRMSPLGRDFTGGLLAESRSPRYLRRWVGLQMVHKKKNEYSTVFRQGVIQ